MDRSCFFSPIYVQSDVGGRISRGEVEHLRDHDIPDIIIHLSAEE